MLKSEAVPFHFGDLTGVPVPEQQKENPLSLQLAISRKESRECLLGVARITFSDNGAGALVEIWAENKTFPRIKAFVEAFCSEELGAPLLTFKRRAT